MASVTSKNNDERRNKIMLRPLPDDFLRFTPTGSPQFDADAQAALALHRELNSTASGVERVPQNFRLNVTVDQAKLVKNYGLARMDPYVRLRVGHYVYETDTDTNGGKAPRWNQTLQCSVLQGVKYISVEIYDECSFSTDERIAWADIEITPDVFEGKVHEQWYPLTGRQGEGQEGAILLVISYQYPSSNYMESYLPTKPIVMVPRVGHAMGRQRYGGKGFEPVQVYTTPAPLPQAFQQPPDVSNVEYDTPDFKQIEEMFPNIDKEIIQSVFEANGGNKDATVNALIQISE